MANEEDECDSSNLFPVANQSDVISFLHKQASKITGLDSCISDDEDDVPNKYLSQSCFASISSRNSSDDLTELKWLNTFKLNEFKDKKYFKNEYEISKLCNDLKISNHENSISFDVAIFLAFYSKSNDQQTPWLLTLKEIYEYIQIHNKQILTKRGWKNLVKQTLITNPCFITTKSDLIKSKSLWTVDPYYRPLLTRAYLTRLPVESKKILSKNENNYVNHSSQSILEYFPPKATMKTKALPRLYERLRGEKVDHEDEGDLINIIQQQNSPISGCKRPRSLSSTGYYQTAKDSDKNPLSSSSSSWSMMKPTKRLKVHSHDRSDVILKTSTLNKDSIIITPCPSNDHMYSNPIEKQTNEYSSDECDSNLLRGIRNNENRRKSSPRKKRLPYYLSNIRISKRIIEQDIELLRKATTNDLSNQNLLDLSLSR